MRLCCKQPDSFQTRLMKMEARPFPEAPCLPTTQHSIYFQIYVINIFWGVLHLVRVLLSRLSGKNPSLKQLFKAFIVFYTFILLRLFY
jgi:hypothetical protein